MNGVHGLFLLLCFATPLCPQAGVKTVDASDEPTRAHMSLERSCADAAQPVNGSRPKLVFLVGSEGSGHHMVEKVLERLQDPEAGGITNMMYADLQKFVDKAEEPTLGKAFLTFLLGHPKSNVFGQFSFPMGEEAHREHDSTARVALSMLVCLNATRAIDLRLLYLRRPAADEVCSTMKRYVPDSPEHIEFYLKEAVDNLLYMSSVLSHPEVHYEVLDFVDSVRNTSNMQAPLARVLRGISTPAAVANATRANERISLPFLGQRHSRNLLFKPRRDQIAEPRAELRRNKIAEKAKAQEPPACWIAQGVWCATCEKRPELRRLVESRMHHVYAFLDPPMVSPDWEFTKRAV